MPGSEGPVAVFALVRPLVLVNEVDVSFQQPLVGVTLVAGVALLRSLVLVHQLGVKLQRRFGRQALAAEVASESSVVVNSIDVISQPRFHAKLFVTEFTFERFFGRMHRSHV